MIVNRKTIYASRLLSDLLLLNGSFFLAAILAQSFDILLQRDHMFILLLAENIIWFFFSNISGFYSDFYNRNYAYQVTNIIKSTIAQAITAILFIFLIKEDLFTRNFIVFYSLLLFVLISLRVILFKVFLRFLRRRGKNIRNILIIGAGEIGKGFGAMISGNPDFGYNLKGYLDNDQKGSEIIGSIDELEQILNSKPIDEVVIALPENLNIHLDKIIRTCNINAVKTHIIPDYFRFLSDKFQVSSIGDYPIISARNEPLDEANRRFIKRLFDIIFSLFIIIFLLSWLIPLIAILSKLTSKERVFYVQDRIGTKNEKFRCYKFRTLSDEKSKDDSFIPITEGDPRITKFGSFLRKTNLDELPQFINVLKGEMSVVGPRPHAVPYDSEYGKFVEEIRLRHNVKPGLTGWAQIHGLRGDVSDEKENKKRTIKRIQFDLWYIENWSLKLDFQIILITIWQMITFRTRAI